MSATAPKRPPVLPHAPPPADAPRLPPRRPRPLHRRALVVGLAASAVLHLLILLFAARTRFTVQIEALPAAAPRRTDGARELQALRIAVAADPGAPIETIPPERREEERPPPRRVPATPGAPPAAADPEAPPVEASPSERLRLRMGDPRLWQRQGPRFPPQPSDLDRARARVYGRLGEVNDSLALEAEAARRATDWTATDENGGKWGVSPGKLHLGALTLPLPFGFTPPPGQREAVEDRARKDAEIGRQAETERFRENFKDRVKEIRERKDREREEKKKAGAGSD